MANILWSNQVLCTVEDVTDRISHPEVPLRFSPNTDKSSALEVIIKKKINTAKQYIYNDLAIPFKKKIPETVDKWLNYKRFLFDNQKQSINRDLQQMSQVAGLSIGAFMETGVTLDLYWFLFQTGINIHPRTISNFGPPTNGSMGTGSGTALPGDVCVDGQNWHLYINTSENINSPLWIKWQAVGVMDNLLNIGYTTNAIGQQVPGIFLPVAVNKVLELLAEDGSLSDRAGFDTSQFYMNVSTKYRKDYEDTFKKYSPLVEINIDGTGTQSDYDIGITSPQQWIMA